MSKISKTAKASMIQTATKSKVAWTPENAIPEIRRSREAKLFLGNMELIDVLLGEYDSLLIQRAGLAISKAEYGLIEKYLSASTEQDAFVALNDVSAVAAPQDLLPAWVQAIRTKIDDFKTLSTMAAQNRATITVLRESKQAAESANAELTAEVARLTETLKTITLQRDEALAKLEQERDVRLLLSGENAKLARETGEVISNIHETEATILDAGHKA